MRRIFIFFTLFIVHTFTFAQSSFLFTNLNISPRIEALGGEVNAIIDSDVNLCQSTPSLLNSAMDGVFSFNISDYFLDITGFSFSFAKDLKQIGMFSIGLKAINYGDFRHRDILGNDLGTFSANDQMVTLGLGKSLNKRFIIGINISFLNSNYEQYHATAVMSNVSATYHNVEKRITTTLLLENIGRELILYSSINNKTPLNLQLGISRELQHLPFRFSIIINNINRFNVDNKLVGEYESVMKNILRHFILGGELSPFKRSFYLRGGLNFQRRFDMKLDTRPLLVGFSCGIGFKVSKFDINYSRSAYHIAGYVNNFSIATNLANFGIE